MKELRQCFGGVTSFGNEADTSPSGVCTASCEGMECTDDVVLQVFAGWSTGMELAAGIAVETAVVVVVVAADEQAAIELEHEAAVVVGSEAVPEQVFALVAEVLAACG